jgi:hypothetical protein
MAYQIIPNLTYLNRPVYTRNPALANAAGEYEDDIVPPPVTPPVTPVDADAPAGAVPDNNENVNPANADDEGETYDWSSLTRITGGKKRTRKHLSKNKRNSRKRRKSRRV